MAEKKKEYKTPWKPNEEWRLMQVKKNITNFETQTEAYFKDDPSLFDSFVYSSNSKVKLNEKRILLIHLFNNNKGIINF